MAENDSTTDQAKETLVKKEALAAIQNVKMILSGLAAIAVLRIQAAGESEGGSDLSALFWRDLYNETPWVIAGEIPKGDLPPGLEEGLNRIIFRQASQAWQELFEKAERVFGPEIYELLGESSQGGSCDD